MLRAPGDVLRVLADLRPMAAVGPVSLDEVRACSPIGCGASKPSRRRSRYGRVFVGSPAQARGRSFRVVFVPGLAERMFPQKPRQDPLLLDDARRTLGAQLATQAERAELERLQLHLAVGAATERLYVSYPRLEIGEGRPRVPSLYALEVWRGDDRPRPQSRRRCSSRGTAGERARVAGAGRSRGGDRRARARSRRAARAARRDRSARAVRGRAQYMLQLNDCLQRSVTVRWARAEKKWTHTTA